MRFIVIACILVASACGRGDGDIDDLIGSSCTADSQCADRCFRDNSDYPGGFCSIQCNSDSDCTSDSFCMDKDGGVCLFECPAFDCARLGPGWVCRDRDRVGGGRISVCTGN
jgi:hypothetical protein